MVLSLAHSNTPDQRGKSVARATLMEAKSDNAVGNASSSLTTIPPELVVRVFCILPLFSDVFALAATCHRLESVWAENVNSIYKKVAPKSIQCEHHARVLLADLGGPALGCPISSPRDVVCMLRNSRVVEKNIRQFEKQIARRAKCKSHI
jgi:hypothetical protein